jgi:hypothetical protein
MNPAIVKEYYIVNGTPVVMVLTDARIGMQTWVADRASGIMKRDYSLMMDIVRDDHEGRITEDTFNAYCKVYNISNEIPPKSLVNSFYLAQKGQGLVKNVPLAERQYKGPLACALNIA